MGARGSKGPKEEVKTVVKLHIYDVGTSTGGRILNNVLRTVGTGAFHTGVEVCGWEWSFSAHDGVSYCEPRQSAEHRYRETVIMGFTRMPAKEIWRLLVELKAEWPPSTYHNLRQNCCHFCDQLCRSLGVGAVPDWVVSLARRTNDLGPLGAALSSGLSSGGCQSGSSAAGGGGKAAGVALDAGQPGTLPRARTAPALGPVRSS